MGDHHDPAAKCIALYALVVRALDTLADGGSPSSVSPIAEQLRSLCLLLERLLEQCETDSLPDTSPIWRELRTAQREFNRLQAQLRGSTVLSM